jgi:Zn-dependent protease/predicted transcriptional regulator
MKTSVAALSVPVVPGRSYRIGRIAGIPVGVSPWWLVIVALITWSLGSAYFPEQVHGVAPAASYALGLASALLLFASILLHEFGHAIIARRHGIQVQEIDLWLLGGVSIMQGEAHEPSDELRYALAGPAVTAAMAATFAAISLLLPSSASSIVRALVDYQLLINCLILGFNLMPAFPLDGGRVLRALLWRRSGDMGRATATAASVGRVFGYLLIALGALEFMGGSIQGLWLVVIGFFIVGAAGAQAMNAQVRAVLSGVNARRLMSTPLVTVPSEISLEQAGSDYFMPYRYTAFPAVDARGRLVGVLTLGQVEAVPPPQRSTRRVADIVDRDPALTVSEDEDVSGLLERPAFARLGRAVVVDAQGAPVGLLSITDVQRSIRASHLSSRAPTPRGDERALG